MYKVKSLSKAVLKKKTICGGIKSYRWDSEKSINLKPFSKYNDPRILRNLRLPIDKL